MDIITLELRVKLNRELTADTYPRVRDLGSIAPVRSVRNLEQHALHRRFERMLRNVVYAIRLLNPVVVLFGSSQSRAPGFPLRHHSRS
jgi:hypothetical protein